MGGNQKNLHSAFTPHTPELLANIYAIYFLHS